MYRCLDDVAKDVADVVLVDQDARLRSEKDFNLTSLLYEFSTEFEQNYVTVAVVKTSSSINTFNGKFIICFLCGNLVNGCDMNLQNLSSGY